MHDFATMIIVAFIEIGLLIVNDDVININVFDAQLEEFMVCMQLQVLEVFQKKLSFFY
jgi:hypothetical protein